MAALLSEHTARLFGMYPRKGAISVGGDADIVVWDPAARWTISAETQHQNCDYTPYEGMAARGRAKAGFSCAASSRRKTESRSKRDWEPLSRAA